MTHTTGQRSSRKFTDRLALAAGSLGALSAGATDAAADIIHVTGAPVTLNLGSGPTSVDWDVDGDHGADFRLSKVQSTLSYTYRRLNLQSNGLNGRGIVGKVPASGHVFQNLMSGLVVGPTLAAGYYRDAGGHANRQVVIGSNFSGFTQGRFGAVRDFTSGSPGFIGFAFDAGGTELYGWANVTFDVGFNGSATINEWAYENMGNSIMVGQTSSMSAAVPEPSSLGMLALGACGLAAWRRRRKSEENQDSLDATEAS